MYAVFGRIPECGVEEENVYMVSESVVLKSCLGFENFNFSTTGDLYTRIKERNGLYFSEMVS